MSLINYACHFGNKKWEICMGFGSGDALEIKLTNYICKFLRYKLHNFA
jgi:hypothetical protein